MNPEIKAKWLAALRSGKYRRTESTLMTSKGGRASYCCLGVLSKFVLGTKYKPSFNPDGTFRGYEGDVDFIAAEGMPSLRELNIAGISLVRAEELASMNDDGTSFRQIADYIEENL